MSNPHDVALSYRKLLHRQCEIEQFSFIYSRQQYKFNLCAQKWICSTNTDLCICTSNLYLFSWPICGMNIELWDQRRLEKMTWQSWSHSLTGLLWPLSATQLQNFTFRKKRRHPKPTKSIALLTERIHKFTSHGDISMLVGPKFFPCEDDISTFYGSQMYFMIMSSILLTNNCSTYTALYPKFYRFQTSHSHLYESNHILKYSC